MFRSVKKQPLYKIGGCSLRSGQLLYSPRTSTCRIVTYSVHWQVATWVKIQQ